MLDANRHGLVVTVSSSDNKRAMLNSLIWESKANRIAGLERGCIPFYAPCHPFGEYSARANPLCRSEPIRAVSV